MPNSVNWFEIPVTDMDRSIRFYSQVFQIELEVTSVTGSPTALFPHRETGEDVGSLTQGEGYTPSMNDPLIYLNGQPDVAPILARVEAAGGKVLVPKMHIGENGYIGILADSEGNRIGVHAGN